MENKRYSSKFEAEMDRYVITDKKTGYSLLAALPHRAPNLVNRVAFSSLLGKSTQPVPITNRDVAQYATELPGMPFDPTLRYVEIAAGLGGLAEYVVKNRNCTGPRPVIIDPADYGAMAGLMDFALDESGRLGLAQDTQLRILDLRLRCDIIRNAARVRLLNMTFAEAFEQHPELRGVADVVVELYGASLYPDVQGEDRLDVYGASQRQYAKYVELLRRDVSGEMVGTVCMTVPSQKAVVHSYGRQH